MYHPDGDAIVEGCARVLERMAEQTYGDYEGAAAKLALLRGAQEIRKLKNQEGK